MGLGLAILGGSVISGLLGSSSTKSAANQQAQASAQAVEEQRRQFDINQANQQPFLDAGTNALSQLQSGIGQFNQNLPQFGNQEALPQFGNQDQFNFDLESDPGFIFARDEALKATNRAQASQGGFNSGNRLAALNDRAVGVASQFANDAFNRQLGQSNTNFGRDLTRFGIDSDRNNQTFNRALTRFGIDRDRESDLFGRQQNFLNRLSAISGVGQSAANQVGGAGAQSAANIGNILTNSATNQGNFGIQGANALNNAIQGGTSNFLLSQALNRQPLGFTDNSGFGIA